MTNALDFARTLHTVGVTVVVTARRAEWLERRAEELPGTIASTGHSLLVDGGWTAR